MASEGAADKANSVEGVRIRRLNIEKGSERFSYHSDSEFPPQTASWRNNLIALSQRRNLLFAAVSHQIYVWEPAGASQTLGRKPEMIITPVMKKPESVGYIAPYLPHAINNMLVGDLGLEEVLLVVTDSGNVCGYRVEAIFSALERAGQENVLRPLDDTLVYPFFIENVESSAWGLAIHKFSRQIAVSANTGLITVFAFALVDPGTEGKPDSDHTMGASDAADDDQPWYNVDNSARFLEMRNQMPDTYRMRNVRMTYTGHFTNIPSVSFLNCDLDPNGTWMLSTDIDNKLIVWKVWESLNPFNVFHFNDSTFHFVPGMMGNEDRGWSVLALDPRTFRPVKNAKEACGGLPQLRVKDGQEFLDITKLTARIPDASHLYNYFPPAFKAEPENPALPDIFSPDCRIASPSDQESVDANRPTFTCQPDDAKVTPHAADDAADNVNVGSTIAGVLRPSDSTDAFSHSAVDGSAQENHGSQGISPDADEFTETQRTPNLSAGDTAGNGAPAPLQNIIQRLSDAQAHAGTAMTAADFLQLALIEGFGGDEEEEEEEEHVGEDFVYDADEDEALHDSTESEENGDEDEEMGEDEDDNQESDDDLGGYSDHFVGPRMRTAAYNAFDPSAHANFPILHFSQTDIRLIPRPFAHHHTVACCEPLRQPFTHPVPPIRARDRFNMVQYIPEHGIVVAVSQKGRAAIISLTESEETGMAFRVDWIVPFESQEKYGERPLVSLLGMGVSPVQGFEMPPDIPYIPRGDESLTDLAFRYRLLSREDELPPDTVNDPSQPNYSVHEPAQAATTDLKSSDSEPTERNPPTNAERHAWASRIYRPDEPWRGWNKSRHYRLFLMYADHTVMTYEFWYGGKTENGSEGESDGEICEDPYLMV